MAYTAGDVLNFEYAGKAQTVNLPPGRYKLEVWGAQGGYRSSSSYGGKGGYSVGIISLTVDTNLFIYVGGSGNTGGTAGGFNGGGARNTHKGGGGASDIRIGQDSLYARVIVAGGGGSDGATNKTGMYGGGNTGGSTTQSYGTGGYGGTQTGVSSSSWQTSTQPTSTTTQAGAYAGFGFGGNGIYRSNGYGGAGGGGWYGGSGSYPDSSGDDDRGGGGGSGFVWTGSNAPSGYLLGSEYYLTDASTIAGNSSMPSISGGTETGHSGDGYARVTVIELYKVTPDKPENFRQTSQTYRDIGLAWDAVQGANGYKLYKDGVLLSTQSSTTYTDSGMLPDEKHTYSVVAYNNGGNSEPSTLIASTKFAYYAMIPVITDATFSVNPVDINKSTVLTVSVTDEFKLLEPIAYYSNEIYSGEV